MLAVSNCKFTESFANTPVAITSDNVADYIYTVYKADVKAIQNLADIAMKLQAGGIIVPGNMTVQNTLNVSSDSNLTGKLNVAGDSNLTGKLNVQNVSALNGISLTNNLSFNKGANKFIIYNGNPDNGGKDDGLYVHYYNPAWASRPLVIEKDTVTVGNGLNVGGSANIAGALVVKGSITLSNGMHYFKQQMDLSGPLWANQDASTVQSTVKNPDGGTYKGTDWILSISGFTFWNDDGGNVGPNRLTPFIYKDGLWHVQCACSNHWPRHLVVSIVAIPLTMFSHNWGPYDLNALNYPGYPNG